MVAARQVGGHPLLGPAGLRVDLSLLRDPEIAFWAVVVLAIASISKFAGSLIGARLSGLATREGMALGTALNARGALEIVIATVGLSLGVLNDASYTIVVIMAIATSVMAPPLLRAITRDWAGSLEEQERIEREQQLALAAPPTKEQLEARRLEARKRAAEALRKARTSTGEKAFE